MPDLRRILRIDLAAARKDRDAEKASLIRTLIAAIENAEAVDPATADGATEVPRRQLDDVDILGIVTNERLDLEQAADHYERIGHPAEAKRLRSLTAVVDNYADLIRS
jgi:uncharacterized protein YqeY